MRWARGLVLIFAIFSAIGAAILARKASEPNTAIQPIRPQEIVEILVAARAIPLGETLQNSDVRWQSWPKAAIPPDSIRSEGGTKPSFQPAPVRFPISAGEPISETKLIRNGEGGILASLVAPDMRAVSVLIREETAAGGFIQPNDRVDVFLTRNKRDDGSSFIGSQLLLRGVKVLAMGTGLDGKSSASVKNRTATLELTPDQARIIAGAQSAGEITLALIAASDTIGMGAPQTDSGIALDSEAQNTIQILKFGRSTQGKTAR